jgi:YidC/Oxa1 family membrane protein insertase
MDKKNTVIGIALLLAAFGAFFYAQKVAPPAPAPASETLREPPPSSTVERAPVTTQPSTGPAAPAITQEVPASTTPLAGLASDNDLQNVVSLGNEHVEVQFTDFGGAIREVGFLEYPAIKDSPAEP